MKHLKKFMALMLSFIMVFAMGTTAFAEYDLAIKSTSEDTLDLTISDMQEDHEYRIYCILTGKASEGTKITDAGFDGWGGCINRDTINSFSTRAEAIQKINDLWDAGDVLAIIQQFVNLTPADMAAACWQVGENGETSRTETFDAGYYIIVDYNTATGKTVSQKMVQIAVGVSDTFSITSKEVPNTETATLSLNNMEDGYTYYLYQLLTGNSATAGGKIVSHAELGQNLLTSSELYRVLSSNGMDDLVEYVDDSYLSNSLSEITSLLNGGDAETHGDYAYATFQKDAKGSTKSVVVPSGYYVILRQNQDNGQEKLYLCRATTTVKFDTETKPNTFTITGPKNGHSYAVYQIFTGDVYTEGDTTYLSNVRWGKNGTGTVGDSVDNDTLSKLEALSNEKDISDAVVSYINNKSEAIETITDDKASITVVGGYYLIRDLGASEGSTDAYSSYIIKVAGNITIEPKADVPTLEKYVKETNDSTGVTSDWQKYADYDNGDEIPFQLKITIPANYDSYSTYRLSLYDLMDDALVFDSNSVRLYVDNKEISSNPDGIIFERYYGHEVSSVNKAMSAKTDENEEPETGIKFIIRNTKKIDAIKAGSVITIEYTCRLNNSNITEAGANYAYNVAYLIYPNNPNKVDSTSTTSKVKTTVYTYHLVLDKKDENGNALSGANFELLKYNAETEKYDITINAGDSPALASDGESGGISTFYFYGLDAGKYRLVEIQTPSGYNSIADYDFEITADITENVTTSCNSMQISGTDETDGVTIATSSVADGIPDKLFTASVINKKGVVLPGTGGIGTTIFTATGAVLMIGAVSILIYRKRKATNI